MNKLTDAYGSNQIDWDVNAYMTGIMALYRLTGEKWALDSATKWSNNNKWTASEGVNTVNADHQCCEQTFCEIYLVNGTAADRDKMTKPSLDNMIRMFDVNRSTGRKRWYWSDALYMAPPAIVRIYESYKSTSTSDANRLLDSMDVYWKDCAAYLYSDKYKLWFRDGNYLNAKAANGSPVFWSGCTAWAIAGLARVLEFMPAGYKSRPYYEQQFRDVCDALRKVPALGQDGLWRTSLLDYNQFPDKESIASAFFAFSFAWGINNGLLDRTIYEPLVRKTWSALVKNIGADGRLQWCQTINKEPDDIQQSFTAPEGEGAFILLAEELVALLSRTPISQLQPPVQSMEHAKKSEEFTQALTLRHCPSLQRIRFDVRGKSISDYGNALPLAAGVYYVPAIRIK
jgi:rhamnogalacturonyl hydrolase YesR